MKKRERVGSEVAYGIDWKKHGFVRVIHVGGTVHLTHRNGKEYKIVVEES